MARKRESKQRPGAAGDDDLEVLHPERRATIAGREVTVREYGFVEGLRLQPLVEPIVADLQTLLGGGVPTLEAVLAVLGRHADRVVALLAVAADVDEEWVAGLSQDDGHLLLMLWWGANGPFYLRAAAMRRLAAARAGATSTPPLSPPASATPSASGA